MRWIWVFLAGACWAQPAFVAASNGQTNSTGTTTSIAITLPKQPCAGCAVVLAVALAGGATIPTNFTASGAGCTWPNWNSLGAGKIVGSNTHDGVALLMGNNCSGSGGTSVTLSYSSTSNVVRVGYFNISGVDTTSSAIDKSTSNSSSSTTTISTGSVTPTVSTDFCFAVEGEFNGSTFVSGPANSWNALDNIGGSTASKDAYFVPNSTSSQSTSWTYTSTSMVADAAIACAKSGSVANTASVSEVLAVRDLSSVLGSHVASTLDAFTGAQFPAALGSHFAAPLDALLGADTRYVIGSHFAAPLETLRIAEARATLASHFAGGSDVVSGMDLTAGLGSHFASTLEVNSGRDSSLALGTHFAAVLEAFLANDSGTRGAGYLVGVREQFVLTDSTAKQAAFGRASLDLVLALDSANRNIALLKSTSELLAAPDSSALRIGRSVATWDFAGAAEFAVRTGGYHASVLDAMRFAEVSLGASGGRPFFASAFESIGQSTMVAVQSTVWNPVILTGRVGIRTNVPGQAVYVIKTENGIYVQKRTTGIVLH